MTLDDLKDAAETMARALAAIARVVAGVTGSGSPSPRAMAAADALVVVSAIVETVKNGLEGGTMSPKEAKEALDRFLAKIQHNDRAADDAIARRFGKG